MGLSPDSELERRRDCACPFEDGARSTHPELGDTCFADCLAAFLTSKFDKSQIDDYVCQSLQETGGGGDAFYPLYYLDQKWCGLVPKSFFGQDPNVDNIINTCNGINFPNLTDPGVPPQSYKCDLCSQPTSSEANRPTQGPVMHLSSTSASFTTTGPTTTEILGSSTILASSSASSTDTVAAPTNTGTTNINPVYSVPTTATATTDSHSRDQLPTEAIVAIAVCTVLAVAGAVLLLLCVLRRRRKQQNDYSGGDMRSRISRIVHDFTIPPASSPEPLISPTQSYTTDRPPLTPPLRLRDRKLLPSLMRPLSRSESIVFGSQFDTHHSNHSNNSSQYSVYSQKKKADGRRGGPRKTFPTSPIYSPTSDKLEPRQELTHHKVSSSVNSAEPLSSEPSSPPYTRLKSPPPVAFTFPPRSSLDNHHHQCSGSPPQRGALSSMRKGNTSTSSSSEYTQDYHTSTRSDSTGTTVVPPQPLQQQMQQQQQQPATTIPACPFTPSPPSSPIRPRRPHDEPLEIPDLVSPLTTSSSPGPPPSRALPPPPPPPPPPHPGSGQTSPAAASEIGVATTTTTANTASPSSVGASRRSPGSISLRSLQEQQQHQHHHRHQESGSGGGGGGGGGGSSRAASRDSWGSWGEDTTGGRSIVGVALSPPPPDGTVYPYPDH